MIVSTDDRKTCVANFCFNQIRAQFVMFGLPRGIPQCQIADGRESGDSRHT